MNTTQPLAARIREVISERRLPYRLQSRWDRLAVRFGLREKTIRRDGLRFRVRRQTCDEMFVANVVVNREYNPPGYEIEPGDVVVDVGGNIGTFAIQAACTASRVIAVEPNADNHRLLIENVRLNKARNVSAIQAAVSDSDGQVVLYCTDEGGYHSIESDRMWGHGVSVPALCLDTIFDSYNVACCDFLKVDCEGAEHRIFHSLSAKTFSRIRKIAMEWHGAADRDSEERKAQGLALAGRLIENGFHVDQFCEHPGTRCGMIFARR
jgi:FkbM family methyltransferase